MDSHNRKNLLEKFLEGDISLNREQKLLCNDERIESFFLGAINDEKLFSIKVIAGDFFQNILGFRRQAGSHAGFRRALQYKFVALFRRYIKHGVIEKYNKNQYKKCKNEKMEI